MARWQDLANCKGRGEWFFANNPADQSKAKELCSTCQVMTQCLEESELLASVVNLHGVWAGMNRVERDRYLGPCHTQWSFDDRKLRPNRLGKKRVDVE